MFGKLLVLLLAASPAIAGPAFPLKVSANKRYLVDQRNVPVFLNGDTAWSLIAQVSKEDAELYLRDRASRGVNSIIVTSPEVYYCSNCRDKDGPQNFYGDGPFTKVNDFTTPNEAYWKHADWVIRKAGEYGIQVLLCPCYTGFQKNKDGWWTDDWENRNSVEDCAWYGRWVGKRYRDFSNIVWVMGNDRNPRRVVRQARRDGQGDQIREPESPVYPSFTQRYVLGGSCRLGSSARSRPWLTLNATYDYPGDAAPSDWMYVKSYADYNRTPVMPFYLFESHYEYAKSWGNGTIQGIPLNIRKEAYQSAFCGSTGHHYGNNAIWGIESVPDYQPGCDLPWKEHLNDPGTSVLFIGQLLNSRAWHTLVPDQDHTVMTAGYGSGSSYAPCTRTSDGTTVMAFIPDSRTVTIDMAKISGKAAKCWWFNPRSGESPPIGDYPTSGKKDFRTPDNNDWVLVIDDAAKKLPGPGATPKGKQ